MKSPSNLRPAKSRSWKRPALVLFGLIAVVGLSGCHCYPGHGYGYSGGHHYHSSGGYGGGYGGGYCR